jgi:hypothetical protein
VYWRCKFALLEGFGGAFGALEDFGGALRFCKPFGAWRCTSS